MYIDAHISGESFDSIYNEIEHNFSDQRYETVIQLCDVLLNTVLPSLQITEIELHQKYLSVFYYKAESLVYTDELEDSVEYYAKAIELAEQLKDIESEIELILTYLEVVIQNQLDREVDSYFQRISDLHSIRKDNTILSQWYALKAGYAFNCEQFEDTIKFCQLFERFQRDSPDSLYSLDVATLQIRANNAIGNQQIALELSKKSINEFQLLLRTEKYCELLVNHGLLEYNNDQIADAIATLQQAFQISDEEGFSLCALNALYTIGFVHFSNEKFEEALSIGLQFLSRKDFDFITELLSEVIVFVGVSYVKLERWKECKQFIEHHLQRQETEHYFLIAEKLQLLQKMVDAQLSLL